MKWKAQSSAVTLNIKQIPNILGALSFLIVDDKFFIMAIPDTTKKSNEEQLRLDGLQLVLNFEDAEGVITQPMQSFFSRLFNDAEPIYKLECKKNTITSEN
jgi:hypothetical protein